MAHKHIKTKVEDGVAVVVMDRPPVNAQNAEFRNEIIETFDAFNDRDDVRVNIRDANGNTVKIPTADIEEEIEGKSLMPQGLK